MKRRVVRLNESELTRLVERIVNRVNKNRLSETNRFIRENESDMYRLEWVYTTGDEDYDDEDFIEGLLVVDIPKSRFQQIMGVEYQEEVEPFNGRGIDLGNYMEDAYHRGNYVKSINRRTRKSIVPDINDSFTQGSILVDKI